MDKAARSKTGVWKMQEWTYRHGVARYVDNAGVDNSAPCGRGGLAGVDKSARCGKGGHCRNGQCGTMWQGWTMQEWTDRYGMARVDNAGEKTCPSKVNVKVKIVTVSKHCVN